jgi:hypothetical protein
MPMRRSDSSAGLTAIILRPSLANGAREGAVALAGVDGAPLHAAGDRDELAGDVA